MNSSGLTNGINNISTWIMRFSVINLMWLLFNIPLVIIVVSMWMNKTNDSTIQLIIPAVILAPLLLFPATTAMFASARNWVMQKEEHSLIRFFWKYYRENYKQSVGVGVLLTIVWVIWGVDYYYFSKESVLFMGSFLLMGFLLYVYTINLFSIQAHYNEKLIVLLKKAFLITVGSPLLAVVVLVSNGIIFYMSINGLLFLLPFFTFSLVAYLSFSAFYRRYLKLVSNPEK
ncbi:DUF624 domain-containing protein [Caldibacillus lycopersici]|uniref:DUF624 domain-containing protein n=1 Tax=Perspicuibacillus lycopersici TaxID=1325689 RepID=A0AAE3IWT2_9BACI|nr:DUF624 domain-containing protein [Perspicuibacillus lycopersici]MCU9615033.1 DUF624 domain-containing protein [Perspicuibacillus lycopersici]